MRLTILLILLGSCARAPVPDGLTQITEESIRKKEGIEIQVVPFKNPLKK